MGKHRRVLGIALAVLAQACPVLAWGQNAGGADAMVPILETLARTSGASASEVLDGIQALADLGFPSSSGASILLDRANIMFEPDPEVRAAAVAAFPRCCPAGDLENRMVALRVARVASAASEPDPQVRCAALGTLARFRCAEALARIQDSAQEAGEPDAAVRKLARDLVVRGR